jgi:hypothetical protein
MYQVNASFDVVTATRKKLNWFQRLFGNDGGVTMPQDGTVSFVSGSIQDIVTKLQYLIGDLDTIKILTVNKM